MERGERGKGKPTGRGFGARGKISFKGMRTCEEKKKGLGKKPILGRRNKPNVGGCSVSVGRKKADWRETKKTAKEDVIHSRRLKGYNAFLSQNRQWGVQKNKGHLGKGGKGGAKKAAVGPDPSKKRLTRVCGGKEKRVKRKKRSQDFYEEKKKNILKSLLPRGGATPKLGKSTLNVAEKRLRSEEGGRENRPKGAFAKWPGISMGETP